MGSILGNVRHVADEYRRFIKSSYRLADPSLRAQFERHVDDAEVLVKGPYVTLAREFQAGSPLAGLLREGLGAPALANLNWTFGNNALYAHQDRAFRVVESGRNVIVTSGTGSGKTEAFLLPVLADVLRAKAAGIQGTKAILLYPMNALANDQLMRLRALIRGTGVPITFALYTGESEETALTIGPPLDGHELTRREDIRRAPPDIVLTNYKQLEFLLIRRVDRPLFTSALRFLVLDELHSYRGALATEVACLIRRLRARCGAGRSALRCIGTSATVSQDAGGDQALARFATTLFDAPFEASDIIGEEYVTTIPVPDSYEPLVTVPDAADVAAAARGDDAAMLKLAEQMAGRKLPDGGDVIDRIQASAASSAHILALRELAGRPASYHELGTDWKTHTGTAALTGESAARIVEALILLGSVGDERRPPLLRPKLHSFFHGVYDVGLCMNPACRVLVKDGQESCPACASAIRPAVLCRTCGQDYVKVKWDEERSSHTLPNDEFLSDDNTAFIASRLVVVEQEDDDATASAPPAPPTRRRANAKPPRWGEAWVEHRTGRVSYEPPEESSGWSRQYVLRGRGTTCQVCKGRYSRGDILTLLRTGVAASVSVLTTHHLDNLSADERKLLVFADNRQEAAHQAGYMGDRHRQFAVRHAINHLVGTSETGGLSLEQMHIALLDQFQQLGLARRRLAQDERRLWESALRYEAVSEFCRGTLQRTSLENLGLVAIEYEFLDEALASPAYLRACEAAELGPSSGAVVVRAMLDFMRRRRAASFAFYQQYIDETRTPWSYLTEEPYSVSFAEYERGPVAFMFDRPSAARGHQVSSWKFEALVKDVARGGAGGLAKLVRRATNLDDQHADEWTRAVIDALVAHEIVLPIVLPERVRQQVEGQQAYQVAARAIRAVPGGAGFRCVKCQTWRPYKGPCCLAGTVCSGTGDEQRPAQVDLDHYYVRLYTEDRPRRLAAREHTAQIEDQERAKRESMFKQGHLDVLVCSPTLELGVDIGQLPSIVLRNAPPTPANYLQRAGRAGRRLRIGYVSTFCGMGPHDRHCFEDPAWLVRGEFRPPTVRLRNERIVQRHVRSLALEELNQDFSWLMGDLLHDPLDPADLELEKLNTVLRSLVQTREATRAKAAAVFHDTPGAADAVARFDGDLRNAIDAWHEQVKRLHREFQELERIVSTREIEQKRRARQRAYRELTLDPKQAHVLTYLAEAGLLPSYQFPTDTFALDPGVADTPTLRRPAWIALFEFAPGNLVYANGHKLKNIRAFFAGGGRRVAGAAATGGQVERFCFCDRCGFASAQIMNNCPRCNAEIGPTAQVALLESFEAEENTQITSAEDARQRVTFDRQEYVLDEAGGAATLYSYELLTLEYRERAQLLATNWGKARRGDRGEQFQLCASCGRHRPSGLTGAKLTKWNDDHGRFCNGTVDRFILGYQFTADVLVVPVPAGYLPTSEELEESFVRTLGKALVAGAQEMLEIEPDEIAFMAHRDGAAGWSIALYETSPGGAGYLNELAGQLGAWARASHVRLFGHVCDRACYRCLKTYRNQFDHAKLNKELVRGMLFALSGVGTAATPAAGTSGDAMRQTQNWLDSAPHAVGTAETPIETALLTAIRLDGRIPLPVSQHPVHNGDGSVLSITDFAYPNQKIAIFCDGFAFHGNVDTLSRDAQKRNRLQTMGWLVLTFWGRQVLRAPARCADEVRAAVQQRSGLFS